MYQVNVYKKTGEREITIKGVVRTEILTENILHAKLPTLALAKKVLDTVCSQVADSRGYIYELMACERI